MSQRWAALPAPPGTPTPNGSEEGPTSTKLLGEASQREGWRPYLLLGFALLAVGLSAWRPIPVGVWHDDGVYALVGQALAEGHGFTYQGVVGAPPAVKFPPVYPSFVAGLWTVLGDVASVTLAGTLANLVFLAVAGTLLARALRTGGGLTLPLALLAGGMAVASADVLRTSSALLSEPLFLALGMACFALWSRVTRGERSACIGLAVLLVLAISTRAAGLALVLGFGLALALGPNRRLTIPVIGPALALWMAWSAWAGRQGAAVPVDMADLLGPYSGWIREQFFGDPASFMAQLPVHAAGVFERVAVLLLPRMGGAPLWLAAVPLVGLAAAGWLAARRDFPPLAWCSLAYGGLLLAWPYLDRRLVVPLHFMVLALIALGVAHLARTLRTPRARGVVWGVAGLWVAFYAVLAVERIASEWPTAAYRIRAERLALAVEALRNTVPDDAVVGAPEFWAGLHLHGGWTVAPSVLFDPASTDAEAPSWGSPEAQERLWRSAGIEYLLLEQGGVLNGTALDRVEARCPGGVRVLARVPPMMVVQLPWARAGSGAPGTGGAPCPTEDPS